MSCPVQPKPMAISARDRKLLWARSGNRCAFPGCQQELTQGGGDSPFPIGEEAHIIARTPDGPRGDHPMPRSDRDTYPNLILLCPTHHTVIDNDIATYTVEILRQMKADHERWVHKNLSSKGPPLVSLSKLPSTGPDLFGRDRELALLDQAWEDPNTNIVAFIAFGGVGKSALIIHWLQRMLSYCKTGVPTPAASGGTGSQPVPVRQERVHPEGHRRASCQPAYPPLTSLPRRVFGWSFYSQGQREHTVSADLFIDTALRFFGDPRPEEGSPWDKGQRLAALVNHQPTILALDGIEPLQSTIEDGKINDPALDTLLRELAYGMNGLCLLTSRVDFPDLPLSDVVWEHSPQGDTSPGAPLTPDRNATWEPRPRGDTAPALRVTLERLSTEAGSYLLRKAGVTGLDDELDAAVEEYEGHALALALLGEYLAKFLDADIAKRNFIPPFPDRTRAGRLAFRVMDAYDRALTKDGMEAERSILRMVGLFDRPAGKDCLDALRQPPAIEGVTDHIVNFTDRQWREAVGTLRALRLLSPPPDPDDGSLDAHPLVREWFGQALADQCADGFAQANARLYESLRDSAAPHPATLTEMEPLFHAIRHGCRARRFQEAFSDVFFYRIRRGGVRNYIVQELGALAAHLAVLSSFFAKIWSTPVPLRPGDHALLMTEAGAMLEAVGRLQEAEDVLQAAFDWCVDSDMWRSALIAMAHRISISIAAGRLSDARSMCEETSRIAVQSRDSFCELVERTAWGGTLLHEGRLAEARNALRQSVREREQDYSRVAHFRGRADYQYLDLLLHLGEGEDVRAESTRLLEEARRRRWVLVQALAHISAARALHQIVLRRISEEGRETQTLALASSHFDQAVELTHTTHHYRRLPSRLLARASFHRDFGDRDQAERDLTEALDLSTRIGLRLHETDARLLQGHMALDEDPPDLDAAEPALARATQLVTETGYHLRDADILILEGRLLSKTGNKETGRAKLKEAITVARREEKDGCIYQLAVDQATRCLNEIT